MIDERQIIITPGRIFRRRRNAPAMVTLLNEQFEYEDGDLETVSADLWRVTNGSANLTPPTLLDVNGEEAQVNTLSTTRHALTTLPNWDTAKPYQLAAHFAYPNDPGAGTARLCWEATAAAMTSLTGYFAEVVVQPTFALKYRFTTSGSQTVITITAPDDGGIYALWRWAVAITVTVDAARLCTIRFTGAAHFKNVIGPGQTHIVEIDETVTGTLGTAASESRRTVGFGLNPGAASGDAQLSLNADHITLLGFEV